MDDIKGSPTLAVNAPLRRRGILPRLGKRHNGAEPALRISPAEGRVDCIHTVLLEHTKAATAGHKAIGKMERQEVLALSWREGM